MKDLLILALNNAFIILEKRTPQTKVVTEYIYIDDIKPLDIAKFMKANNIPDNAYFGGKPNSYDSFDEICLCYDVVIPTTEKEKLKFKKDQFSIIAFKFIFDLLTKNEYKHGYKRIGFNSALLKDFDNTTVYDMFINNDFDRLEKYYSLSFTKVQ